MCVAACCSVLQRIYIAYIYIYLCLIHVCKCVCVGVCTCLAVCIASVYKCCSVLQRVAMFGSLWQCFAVCCRMLQGVVGCCSVAVGEVLVSFVVS